MKTKYRGIFDSIKNAITFYLMRVNVEKEQLWKLGINVFEMSLFIEEYLISGKTELKQAEKNGK